MITVANLCRVLFLMLIPDGYAGTLSRKLITGSSAASQGGINLATTIVFSLLIHSILIVPVLFIAERKAQDRHILYIELAAEKETDYGDKLQEELEVSQGPADLASAAGQKMKQHEITAEPVKREDNPNEKKKENEGNPSEDDIALLPGTGFSFGALRFDTKEREIYEKAARQGKTQTDKASVLLEIADFPHYEYLKMLKDTIEKKWLYPAELMLKGSHGDLFVKMTVTRNGQVSNIEIVKTSGYPALDESVIRAVKESSPFPKLPEKWIKDSLTITGHFVYEKKGPDAGNEKKEAVFR
jgi:TonB family protein